MMTHFSEALKPVNSAARIDILSASLNNPPMITVEDTRRQRLALLQRKCGLQSRLSYLTGRSPAQLSQWINASVDPKTGKPRVISRASARGIEKSLGLSEGWLDTPISNALAELELIKLPTDPLWLPEKRGAKAGSPNTAPKVEMIAGNTKPKLGWPFQFVDQHRYENLSRDEKIYVQHATMAAIKELEDRKSKRRTAG